MDRDIDKEKTAFSMTINFTLNAKKWWTWVHK